jgi:tetratricopeptide (TPR) repeat protein
LLIFTTSLFSLFTVFIIDNHLAHSVVSSQYFWLYFSMGLVSITTAIHSLINKQPFRISLTDCFVFLFTGSIFFSALVINNASANATKLVLLALLSALYFCLRNVFVGGSRVILNQVQDAMTVNFICFFIILTGLIEAVWGLQQLYGFKPSQHAIFKLTGSFFNPGPYAGYLAVVFPLALYFWVKEFRVKNEDLRVKSYTSEEFGKLAKKYITLSSSLLSLITCIAIILVLPAAMSRAAWLAAIAGNIVVVIPRLTRDRLKNDKRLLTGSMGWRIKSAMTGGLIRGWRIKSAMTVLFVAILLSASAAGMYYLKKDSADGRLLTWKVSLSVIARHPFGVGLGHFPGAYGDAQADYFSSGKASETEEYVAGNPEYGFNEFLQIAIESGVVALLLFIGMIVCAAKVLIKKKEWGILGALVALLVFACFSYPFSVLPFPILFVFLLAMSGDDGTRMTQMGRICADNNFKSASIRLIRVISVPLFCLLVTVFCLVRQYPVYDAYKQWNRSRVYYQMGMYKETAKNYEPLYPYLNDQIKFVFEYGRSLSQLGINDSQGIAGRARNDRQHDQGLADQIPHERLIESNKVLQRAMKISCDPMLYNIMGKNYQAMKEYELAEASLQKSTRIVPNRLYPWYLLMKLYIETGEDEKARKMADIVLTKEPKVQSTAVKEMRKEAGRVKN